MVKTELGYNAFLNYFDYSKKDDKIFLPNEIFNDFTSPLFVTNMHRAFGYSYYYLISYLYRNVKFTTIAPSKRLNQMELLEVMGANRKAVNYVIKRMGVLDSLGYTVSDRDYPFYPIVDESGLLDFEMASECNEEMRVHILFPPTFVCKRPVKAFFREKGDTEYTGTFFYFENTHHIDFRVFAKCMSEKVDSFELFYMYGFLKAYEGFINSKDVYNEYLRVSLGFGNAKVKRLLSKLSSMGLVKFDTGRMLKYEVLK